MLGDNLGEQVETFSVSFPSELTHHVKMFAGQQNFRAAALSRRYTNPGKIEIDRVAVHLLRLTDLNIHDIAKVSNGYGLPWQDGLNVDGAELTQLSSRLAGGRVTTIFYFDGGNYHSGSAILFTDTAASVQDAAIGRAINEVVSILSLLAINYPLPFRRRLTYPR